MRPIPITVSIPPPRHVRNGTGLKVIATMKLRTLCAHAKIPCRVTSKILPTIALHAGAEHFSAPDVLYVGVNGKRWKPTRTRALRILEILAHGFHDYAARECICNRGFFCAPKPIGRPRIGKRAMTAKERMQKMRATRRSAPGI